MAGVRRLYVYGLSAVSLLVLAIGLIQLLTVALDQVADTLGASVLSGDVTLSLDQLSLAIALVVVALPIWAIHWWLAERSVAGSGSDVNAERQSTIRGVHFLDVEFVSLVAWLLAAIWLVAWLLRSILGGDVGGIRPADSLAVLAVAGAVWAYHARLRARDLRAARLVRDAAWVSRLYRHAGAFIGLAVAAFGAADVIATTLGIVVDRPAFEGGAGWWRSPLGDAVARMLVGAVVFAIHWLDTERTIRDAERIGEDDRRTRVRRTYFASVLVAATTSVVLALGASLGSLAQWFLGVAASNDPARLAEDVVGPPLAMTPWLAAGIWHLRSSVREGAALDGAMQRSAERVGGHLLSLVGLAFVAAGSARLLGLLLEATIGRPGLVADDVWRLGLAQAVAFAIAGAVLWAWQWSAILRVWSGSDGERATTASRSYLFLAIGGGLLAAVPSAALILYRSLNVVLATDAAAGLGDEIATPLGVAAVAVLTAAYHGRILLRDLRRAQSAAPAVTPAGEGASVALVLRGPSDADVGAVVDELRRRLPAGFTIVPGALPPPPPGDHA